MPPRAVRAPTPHSTYERLGKDWSEGDLDWTAIGAKAGSLPPPLLDDIDWLVPRKQPGDTTKTKRTDQHRREALQVQDSSSFSIDRQRALTFGTYESTICMDSRDLLYRRTQKDVIARKEVFTHTHIDYMKKPAPYGWALVPCVAMRLCRINGALHVYAKRFAEDIWGNWEANERAPDPGKYNGDKKFKHAHPLKVRPARVLLIQVAEWMRRPLQMLFQIAAYLYYHRCQTIGKLTKRPNVDRVQEAYYHELMSNMFTEFAELIALEQAGLRHGPVESLSSFQCHAIREWLQTGPMCHTIGASQDLLAVLPYAYFQDPSTFDWEGDYYVRAKGIWRYTMTTKNLFAFWRAHRCLSLDFFTDQFLLDFSSLHTAFDINFMRPFKGSPHVKWCIMAGATAPGFDSTHEDVPSTLYPVTKYKRDAKGPFIKEAEDGDAFLDAPDDEVDAAQFYWTERDDYDAYGTKKARRKRTGRNNEVAKPFFVELEKKEAEEKERKAAKKAKKEAEKAAGTAADEAAGGASNQKRSANDKAVRTPEQQDASRQVSPTAGPPAKRSRHAVAVEETGEGSSTRRQTRSMSARTTSAEPQNASPAPSENMDEDIEEVEAQMDLD